MKSNKTADRQHPVVIWFDTIQTFWIFLVWMAVFVPGLSLSAQEVNITGKGNTEVKTTGNTINITGGQTGGNNSNLFHTFGQFNVNNGQTANFVSTPNIVNILGRINGGNPSVIDGKIQVSGSNANLFLMNPAGMVFGAGASLNVPGSFTATTANAIGFGDGNWFNAFGNNSYTNLTGNPTSLGFTSGAQPGSIFNAANLTTTPGQSITLVGGTVISTGTIKTAGGNITIATVPGGKLVRLSNDGNPLSLDLPMAAADQIHANPASFTPLSLPELLTSPDAAKAIAASGVKVNATTGEVSLVRDSTLKIANGDTVTKLNQVISQGDVVTKDLDTSIPSPPTNPTDPNPIGSRENPFSNLNSAKNGGNIQIESSKAILTGALDTHNEGFGYVDNNPGSGGNGGNISLSSQTAIKTGKITTSSRYRNNLSFLRDPNDPTVLARRPTDDEIAMLHPRAGNVKLSTKTGDIIIDSISSTGVLLGADYESRGGDFTVDAAGVFRVVKLFDDSTQADYENNLFKPGDIASVASVNASNFGEIKIKHGGTDFVIGASVKSRVDPGGLIYKSQVVPPNGFTFPDGASGSLGLVISSIFTNGSLGVVFTGQNISGISINSTAGTNPGNGGVGTNPGNGGVGTNPGNGGVGTNPGTGGVGTNPGTGGVGTNPGNGGVGTNPGTGGVGTNPGTGGVGTNPGTGGVGTNPGTGGVGTNPGNGGVGTNPGNGGVGTNPGNGGVGTNPGNGGVGTNPGNGGVGTNPGNGGVGTNPGNNGNGTGTTNAGNNGGNGTGNNGNVTGNGTGTTNAGNNGGNGTSTNGNGTGNGTGTTNAGNNGNGTGNNGDGSGNGTGTNNAGNNGGNGTGNGTGTTNAGNNGNGTGTNDGTGNGTGTNNAGNNGGNSGTNGDGSGGTNTAGNNGNNSGTGTTANNGDGSGTGNGNQDGNGTQGETKTAQDDTDGKSEQKVTKRKTGIQCDRNVNAPVAKAKADRLKSELTEKPNTSAADPCDPSFNGNAILQILNRKKSK
jgi:filamentous hemagglutinin family protein